MNVLFAIRLRLINYESEVDAVDGIAITHTAMNRTDSSLTEKELLVRLKTSKQLAFSTLYDQYASVLLGIIIKIGHTETDAIELLEKTFIKIRSEIDLFRPEKQPLFVWLLTIARCTAVDALKQAKPIKSPALQLTTSGRAFTTVFQKNQTSALSDASADSASSRTNELLNAVLFKNCTPEEAAVSFGIPAELARQQLRVAMQQIRLSQKV